MTLLEQRASTSRPLGRQGTRARGQGPLRTDDLGVAISDAVEKFGLAAKAHHTESAQASIAAVVEACWRELSEGRLPESPADLAETGGRALSARESRLADELGRLIARLSPLERVHRIGSLYSARQDARARSRHGVFYTPPALASHLVGMATDAGLDWATARVLDPAAGAGILLAACALRMSASLRHCTPKIALRRIENRLAGWELDPFAAKLAARTTEIALADLCLKAGSRLRIPVSPGDSLSRDCSKIRFDLVIGNPPYGKVKLDERQRERFKRSLFGHANLYGLFADLAVRAADVDGLIAFVSPTSFLAGEYFKALRRLLSEEAPPSAIDIVSARKGVFDGVLQETMLGLFRRSLDARPASVGVLTVDSDGAARRARAGAFRLPVDSEAPWLLPRSSAEAGLIEKLRRMPARLKDYGFTVSTGPVVWNRHKDQLHESARAGAVPLIWAESVLSDGRFEFRSERRNHKPYISPRKGEEWLTIGTPCVLVQRTTAKEQHRRLIAAALPASFLAKHAKAAIENHLNMIRATSVAPSVACDVLAAFLNTRIVDRVFRCISGSVAVSAYELEAMPLPPAASLERFATLVGKNADSAALEDEAARSYGVASVR